MSGIIPALTEWQQKIKQSDEMLKTLLEPLMLSPESPLYETIWALQVALTRAVAKIVGDQCEWLDWYHAENSMGQSAYEACPGHGKPTRKIKTLDDLAWLIEESK